MTGTDGYTCTWSFFKNDRGSPLARDEFDGLEKQGRVALASAMREYKHGRAKPRNVKPIGDGLFELRVSYGSNQFRVLFFHPKRFRAIALVVFYKNTNKIPADKLKLAKARRDAYLAQGASSS